MKQSLYVAILGIALSLGIALTCGLALPSTAAAQDPDPATRGFIIHARVQLPVQVYVPRARDVVEANHELRARFVRRVVRTVQRRPF